MDVGSFNESFITKIASQTPKQAIFALNFSHKIAKHKEHKCTIGSIKTRDFFARLFSFLAYRKKVRYNRVLALSEYLTDRWQKAQQCGFGGNSSATILSIFSAMSRLAITPSLVHFAFSMAAAGLPLVALVAIAAFQQACKSTHTIASNGQFHKDANPTTMRPLSSKR